MSTGEKSDTNSEERIIKAIHNISEQLNYIKSLYKNVKSTEESNEINKIQNSIENLVGDLEEKPIDEEYTSYQLVSDVKDNNTLVISEKSDKVFLPYKVSELQAYLDEYPDEYKSLSDVVNQEYIISIQNFKYQRTARFRETYCLMRDIEMKSIIESFKKAAQLMLNSRINPAVISACKSEEQLDKYVYCAEHGKLDQFNDFKIVFDSAPLNINLGEGLSQTYFKLDSKRKRRKNRGRHNY